jgi:hypothetical protein
MSVQKDGKTEIDVGVIPLPSTALSVLTGCTPLEAADINDAYVVDHSIGNNSIYVIGSPQMRDRAGSGS